ncbi:protein of unassigned function [Methylobacterium oryzae CBMB20]|uniref:Protein of unassigned function n=1 Tax=Methylobacterium oryzae CBMB20 TaxID=693986 RepID=A0A089NRJ6_9HYPH|nr:protein of unassigned function [Methylobacterium oryzae CBMB20]
MIVEAEMQPRHARHPERPNASPVRRGLQRVEDEGSWVQLSVWIRQS